MPASVSGLLSRVDRVAPTALKRVSEELNANAPHMAVSGAQFVRADLSINKKLSASVRPLGHARDVVQEQMNRTMNGVDDVRSINRRRLQPLVALRSRVKP
jgi:hypothetical protein